MGILYYIIIEWGVEHIGRGGVPSFLCIGRIKKIKIDTAHGLIWKSKEEYIFTYNNLYLFIGEKIYLLYKSGEIGGIK